MTKCSRTSFVEVQETSRKSFSTFIDVRPQGQVDVSPLRERATANINRLGTNIQIIRENEILNTYALIAPLTRISTPRTLQLIRSASFPSDSGIRGGDLFFEIAKNKYYLFLISTDIESRNEIVGIEGMIAWCNHVADLYRIVEKPTGVGGIRNDFELIGEDLKVAVEFIATSLRERELGVFRDSTHRCYVQNKYGIRPLDKLRIAEEDFRVDDIDRVTYPGISYCMLSREIRKQ